MHTAASDSHGWCPQCDEPYDQRTFCPRCHFRLDPGWIECRKCQASLPVTGWQSFPWSLSGRITLLRQLDRGGQGAVYVATVSDIDGYQAVKVAVQTGGMTPLDIKDFNERFRRECSLQGTLGSYDDIVKAKESGTTPGNIPFLVMELIRGRTLQEELGERPGPPGSLNPTRIAPMDSLRAVRIIAALCHAVDNMHYHRIIHRDIKPGNIFLTRSTGDSEEIKLGDLGLAWAMEKGQMRPPDPLPNGSPLYMSPEQVLCSDLQGPPSDIYSIGVVAYEMLTGRLPYEITEELVKRPLRVGRIDIKPTLRGPFFAGWLKAHVYGTLIPPQQANPSLPPLLCQALVDCLRQDVNQRISNASDLLARLKPVLEELEGQRAESISLLAAARRQAITSVEGLDKLRDRFVPIIDYVAKARVRLNQLLFIKSGDRTNEEIRATSRSLMRLAEENMRALDQMEPSEGLRQQLLELSDERNSLLEQVTTQSEELRKLKERLDKVTNERDLLRAARVESFEPLDVTAEVEIEEIEEIVEISAKPRLICVSSNLLSQEWIVDKPEMIAGRADSNEIFINHSSVSRRHARFFLEGGRCLVEDLESSNGVRVNGRKYGKAALHEGDLVDLGHVRLRFVAPGEQFDFTRDASVLVVPD